MKRSNVYITFLLTVIIVYLLTHINKIGLHGDEAILGLDGIRILKDGISKPYGMNHYTGILQALLDSVSFKLWKIDVVSIRIGGIILNIVALLLTTKILKRISNHAALIFLLLFAQSVFLLGYSKVAWEVLSFNFLFIAISLVSLYKLEKDDAKGRNLYLLMFLFVTLLGSYNHIIFSSIILAMLSSMILYIWLNQVKPSAFFLRSLSIAFISLFNIICLYLVMHHWIDEIWDRIGIAIFIILIIMIILEVVFFKRIFLFIEFLSKYLFKIPIPTKFIKIIILGIPVLFFLQMHFLKLLDILENEILLIRLFSYIPSTLLKLYFIITGSSIIVFIAYNLISELLKKNTTIWTYFIISYLGVLCKFTNGFSIRYFHIVVILLFLYISINLRLQKKTIQVLLVTILAINMLFVQYTLWQINISEHRKIKAIKFKIGENNSETSAHFLNFSPVLDFVKKNEVGEIQTNSDYFIGSVFEYYKHVYPEIKSFKNSATINYDYKVKGSGFIIESHLPIDKAAP